MATAATRAATRTMLTVGKVEMQVGLFATAEKPGKLAEFVTAGPNGGVLKAEMRARAVPVTELEQTPDVPVHSSDPLADEESWSEALAPLGSSSTDAVIHALDAVDDPPPAALDRIAADLSPAEMYDELGRALDDAVPRVTPEWSAAAGGVDGEYGRVLVEDGSGVEVPADEVRRGCRVGVPLDRSGR